MDRDALAAFLVRRRELLRPADVGLRAGPRRRAVGLRREEVAQLAAMSADYYTRLEQRRGPQPSVQILASLAEALRLSPAERDYLYRMAGHSAPDRVALAEVVAPAMLRVLDRITDTPAFILNVLEETLVQNDAARAFFGDASGLSGPERSAIYRWFVHPARERRFYPADDHDRQSRALVASLRAASGLTGVRVRAREMARELARLSPEFARLWDAHVVSRRFVDHKVLIHPELGPIEVDCQALLTEDESQALLVLTAPPGSEAADKLRSLTLLAAL
jgi:transcriptional regulator with XRE-family HTH domain